jgi:hypothetical protein
MKILCCDRLLKGKPHSDWKEGWELYYAFNNLGYKADIAGKDCPIPEWDIPRVANDYDLIIISENYPQWDPWVWWNWSEIKTPKLFWAVDTHLVNYRPFVQQGNIDFVCCNNEGDVDKFTDLTKKSFCLPLAISKRHYGHIYESTKKHDISFIGTMTPERKIITDKFNIRHITAFGPDYVREMQSSKICFNQTISYDVNGKYFEILASGSFMLTNWNENFFNYVEKNKDIEKMFYFSDDDLNDKIKYYLSHDKERETIAKNAQQYIFSKQSYETRAQKIINELNVFYSNSTKE